MSTFTDAQLDGWACVKCGTDLRTIPKSYFIGYGPRGQLFACPDHASPADRALDAWRGLTDDEQARATGYLCACVPEAVVEAAHAATE
ncbi:MULTISPECIES: hypothetical protein [Rhodococcus]|uniref:Uncharacterized protein n=1 Tax=Rhodococcus opacus RKJ300 = JCM 13270 TaxID=1165867 RepID=I0WWM3_RHOOP|nr:MULTISPECIES: hypothetical protein [Rhodococcus]EID80789.1 hypothetical protein W59_06263 [Rhodococcus opacus RKJ300 = JCM 13270]QQZ15236.1 hypothetical protein GO592_03225 [Rhodococcus sp. 21391]